MRNAIITFSDRGATVAAHIATGLPESQVFVHAEVEALPEAERFAHVLELTVRLWPTVHGLIYVGPIGVAVRAIAPLVSSKHSDPAVVVTDVAARHAVSLLSGHEGGANELALQVANLTGAEPVITTTTEAARSLIVGIGCRKGIPADVIVSAVRQGLELAGVTLDDVRLLASADVKQHEAGMLAAAGQLQRPLRFLAAAEIRNCRREFAESATAKARLGLPAVAEPCALLAGKRTELILPRHVFAGVTVAIAQEMPMNRDTSPTSTTGSNP